MSRSAPEFLDCVTREQLARVLGVSTSTLTYYAYGNGKRYRSFEIPKKSGGTRNIKAPVGGLLAIQKRLAIEFNRVYPGRDYVQGFVEGGSIVGNASFHLNKRQVLNIDLNDFFPSITAGRIIGLLRKRPFEFNDNVASTIAGLACDDGSLPQGAPTSPVLSNIICLRMDKELRALCRQMQATYSRYADDITMSTYRKSFPIAKIENVNGEKTVVLAPELYDVISRNYFSINPKKTRLRIGTNSKFVTGVKVNAYPNLPRNYIRQLRSMLHAWEKYGLKKSQKDFIEKYNGGNKSFANVVGGKIAHLKNVKGDLDPVYRRLYNRYVELEGKGRPKLPLDAIEELYAKVFVVESGVAQGTGFILDGKWLITCNHVAEADVVHYFPWENFLPVLHSIVTVDSDWRSPTDKFDIAAITPKPSDFDNPSKSLVSAPATERVSTGKKYRIIGFPGYVSGWKPNSMTVEVTQVQQDRYGVKNAYVDKKMIGGYSGGPVLDENYRVVGMVRRGTKDRGSGDNDVGYTFLPMEEITAALKQFEIRDLLSLLSKRQNEMAARIDSSH